MNQKVLLLNADATPLKIISWESAIILMLKDVAFVIKESEIVARSQFLTISVPSILMVKKYKNIKEKQFPATRELVLLRDSNTCQYCGGKFESAKLQLEHIVPKSRGGSKSMDNIVAACKKCNDKKVNKTPEEAGMTLLKRPKKVSYSESLKIVIARKYPDWSDYAK